MKKKKSTKYLSCIKNQPPSSSLCWLTKSYALFLNHFLVNNLCSLPCNRPLSYIYIYDLAYGHVVDLRILVMLHFYFQMEIKIYTPLICKRTFSFLLKIEMPQIYVYTKKTALDLIRIINRWDWVKRWSSTATQLNKNL